MDVTENTSSEEGVNPEINMVSSQTSSPLRNSFLRRSMDLFVGAYENNVKKHLQHCGIYNDHPTLYHSGCLSFEDLPSVHKLESGEGDKKRLRKQASALSLSSFNTNSESFSLNDATLPDSQPTSGTEEEYANVETAPNGALTRLTEYNSGFPEVMKTTQVTFHVKEGQMVPKLKQPKGLYALGYDLSQQHSPRWPEEMQVIPERIKHIPYVPIKREPFYKTTYLELQPPVLGEAKGRVVYCYKPLTAAYFVRACVGGATGCDDLAIPLKDSRDNTLIFESRFESGNLEKAIQISEYSYELYLRQDLYCERNTQWYYFQVKNTKASVRYRFSIVNLGKPHSLYNSGTKPLMYSEKLAAAENIGWHRAGQDICYYRNNLPIKPDTGPAYTLTFTCEFSYDDDAIYFAHCYPFTYSDLQDHLLELQSNSSIAAICKQRVLCRSLAGNLVPVLTITSAGTKVDSVKKRVVMITARVHPGETSASWVGKGIVDFLTGSSPEAKALRSQFIFKIIPMLNPDGVIVGNYRCCLTGRDLNRQYRTVLKNGFPSVWYTKHFVMRLMEEHEVFLYCDLHGHSRKHNTFIYGCESRQDSPHFLQERIFPFLLKKYAGDKFSLDSCKYKIQRGREGTGRVVMWRLGVINSFTLEASLGGCTQGKLSGFHITTADYESIGMHFCEALLEYGMADAEKIKELQFAVELQIQQKYSLKPPGRSGSASGQYSSDDKDSSSETDSLSFNLTKLNLKGAKKPPKQKCSRRKSNGSSLEEGKSEQSEEGKSSRKVKNVPQQKKKAESIKR